MSYDANIFGAYLEKEYAAVSKSVSLKTLLFSLLEKGCVPATDGKRAKSK